MSPRTLIVGVGNEWRGDDAFGLHVARYVRARVLPSSLPAGVEIIEHSGEGASLIETWRSFETVILIDCVEAGLSPGSLFEFDASRKRLPSQVLHGSTHQFGVSEAIEMARTLAQLPARVIVVGAQGASYEHGAPLSEPVAGAVRETAIRIAEIIAI